MTGGRAWCAHCRKAIGDRIEATDAPSLSADITRIQRIHVQYQHPRVAARGRRLSAPSPKATETREAA